MLSFWRFLSDCQNELKYSRLQWQQKEGQNGEIGGGAEGEGKEEEEEEGEEEEEEEEKEEEKEEEEGTRTRTRRRRPMCSFLKH